MAELITPKSVMAVIQNCRRSSQAPGAAWNIQIAVKMSSFFRFEVISFDRQGNFRPICHACCHFHSIGKSRLFLPQVERLRSLAHLEAVCSTNLPGSLRRWRLMSSASLFHVWVSGTCSSSSSPCLPDKQSKLSLR